MSLEINETVARKVRDTVRVGLVRGLGSPEPGQMCVEAAVCYALGLPHNDDPICVSPALRAFKIRLNDSAWSSTAARAKGLERLAVAQLGSNQNFDDVEFGKRIAALAQGWAEKAAAIVAAIPAAGAAESAAESAAAWAAESAAESAAWAAKSAAWAAKSAAWAAKSAAKSAAWAAESDSYTAYATAFDKFLTGVAEDVVQVLIAMNAPGCQWLYLTEPPVLG